MPVFKRYEVHTPGTDFRKATHIVQDAEVPAAKPGFVVIKNHYVGINATDIFITNGYYSSTPPPFGCGLDAVGEVVAVGEGVDHVQIGSAVVYSKFGAFAEYVELEADVAMVIPEVDAGALSLPVCGTSALMALERVGQMKSGETVLVTAAAGGTGQFVVQLAKLAGNHVIGTTSSDEKAELLKKLGCDRVINYNKEKLDDVLKTEYPKGVDLVFESVGGETIKTAVDNIAVDGRIIIFGFISNYAGNGASDPLRFVDIGPKLGNKSASLRGFIMTNHMELFPQYFHKLLKLVQDGKVRTGMDPKVFEGLEQIPDAIEYLYARKNKGKIAVKLT